jgi:hypothetical protein
MMLDVRTATPGMMSGGFFRVVRSELANDLNSRTGQGLGTKKRH